ncbi:hypothetical protein B0H16DRAFT_1465857 [Mycena metata]|uniref:Uncharacterized protein n=1 Tax=Mycena metata TaxID=1033252 RepID=A0AAD7IC38_9AGAR|nr:hypothetical protein B0H16DRAFT_1465857 [Mycena metata]
MSKMVFVPGSRGVMNQEALIVLYYACTQGASREGRGKDPHNLVKSYIVSTRSINPSAAVNGGVWTASLPPVPARLFFEADTATARNGVPFTGPVPPVKTVMVFIPTRNTSGT